MAKQDIKILEDYKNKADVALFFSTKYFEDISKSDILKDFLGVDKRVLDPGLVLLFTQLKIKELERYAACEHSNATNVYLGRVEGIDKYVIQCPDCGKTF